jgi:hypothetical protein
MLRLAAMGFRRPLSVWTRDVHHAASRSTHLFERLREDGLFAAEPYDIDGVLVSRDHLLDSIVELTFLDTELGISRRQVTILDIGAGYGRLAHRATTAFENVRYLCADAVPLSTFLCDYYLRFRGVTDRATIVPLDRVAETLARTKVDLAVNIHSFSECPLSVIDCWLNLLVKRRVPYLMIVPNAGTRLRSTERDGTRVDFMPLLRTSSFELARRRPKYGDSDFMHGHGIPGRFRVFYFLFERRDANGGG